jgi:flagellar biosynthesis/type III secretory pathway protein FliH
MNLFSKTTSSSALRTWDVPELGVEADLSATQVAGEQILALFGTGQKNASRGRDGGAHPSLHPAGTESPLTTWLPGDFNLPAEVVKREPWDFVETSLDSFKTVEPQAVKNKSDVEKEKAQVLKDARVQADQILLEARAAAEQIMTRAQTEHEQMKRDGYQQGWNAARSELQSALAATHKVVQETHEWQASLMKDGERILIDMLKELAQTMFGEGVRLDAEALQINLNRIMENAQRLGDLNIFLNPQDANLLDTAWRDYQLLITGNKVRIIPSEKIKPGGCFVKGSMGMVDARVETQLAAILNTIAETNEVGQ